MRITPFKINHPRRGIGFALTAALLAALVTLAATGALRASARTPRASATPVATTINAQFPVFNQPASLNDVLPSNFATQLQAEFQSEQPNLAGSREVTADDGQVAYLVPSQDGVCVINANQSFCVPTAQAAGAASVSLCSPQLPIGQMEIEWLLPAGATNVSLEMTNGARQSYPAGNSVYIAMLPINNLPRTIVWSDSTGQQQTAPTPVPPGLQAPLCASPPAQASQVRSRSTQVRPHAQVMDRKYAPKLSTLGTPTRKR